MSQTIQRKSNIDDILGSDKIGGFDLKVDVVVSEDEEPQGEVIDLMKPKVKTEEKEEWAPIPEKKEPVKLTPMQMMMAKRKA